MSLLPAGAAALAERQHGVLARNQLLDLGMAPSTIDDRVGDALLPVHSATFHVAGAVPSPMRDVWAAVVAVRGGVVSHRTAAALLGALDLRRQPVEVTVGRWSRPEPNGVTVHRSTDLAARWVVSRRGLPVTTPDRIVVDLGAVASPATVEHVLERLIRDRLLTEDQAIASLFALARRGRRGCGVLRAVLAARVPGDVLESDLEVCLRRVCRRWDVPQPVSQHPVVVGGRHRRLDFAYPDLRIAIEIDGYAFHADRRAFDDDRRRANALELAGWLVLRFTWTDLRQRPHAVAAEILDALHLRASTRP